VIASLYDTLGADSLDFLISHSGMEGILVHAKMVDRLISVLTGNKHNVRSVIVIQSNLLEKVTQALEPLGISVYTLESVIARGRNQPVELPKVQPNDVYYVCYSSGTTGTPKGVLVSHAGMTSNIFSNRGGFGNAEVISHYSFLPFAHLFERLNTGGVIGSGGKQMMATGGTVANIMADLRYFKPTCVASVPRIFIRYYDGFIAALNKQSKVRQGIFWGSYYVKRWLQSRHLPTDLLDRIAFDPFKAAFGPNVRSIVTAGAALDAKIHDFFQVVFGAPLRNGYGSSESGTGNIFTPDDLAYQHPGTAGGPILNSLCRLEPIEGYDTPGCGEILIGGYGVSKGYLHDEAGTKALFVDDEKFWIRTGDVGKWDDGALVVVDRLRSIFKLAQGEYGAAEMVTQAYEGVPAVEQLFVYGDSGKICLVGVVIPRRAVIASMVGKETLSDPEFAEAVRRKEVHDTILEAMTVQGKARGLFGFQQIRDIHLDTTIWSPDNSLLTPTLKLRRKNLSDRYRKEIEALYANIAAAQSS
jgi:long-chain acyl-CoA synthetase